ncbi:MAG: hypothetical protein Q8M83_00665 [bacterium]|nr:hypothetical protein [bacterium]
MRRGAKKIITGFLLASFLATFVLSGVVLFPVKAEAQWFVQDVPLLTAVVKKELKLDFGHALMSSAMQATINMITMVGQRVAYDLAVGLASGAKGQHPLAFLDDWKGYLNDVGQDAAGEFIGTLNDDWELLGMGLCNPRLPNIALSIQLGLAERFGKPKPKCEWSQIANSWEALGQEITDPIKLLQHLSLSFQPGASDLSQAMIAFEAADVKVAEKKLAAEKTREEGGGFRSVEDIVSGNIQTPAEFARENLRDLARSGGTTGFKDLSSQAQTELLTTAIIGPEAWMASFNTIASTFTNTLASRLLKIGLEGLFKALIPSEQVDLKSLIGRGTTTGGAGAARAFYSSLITPNIRISSLDIVSELASCSKDKPETASLYQCALDERFAQALREAQRGAPLSVKEAVEKGYLNANKPFGFLNFNGDSPLEPAVDEGYGYHNMKKLRLARVIPVGWELAALKILDLAQASPRMYTLGEVMADFEKPKSNFYKMVDPNWILKAPPTQCAASVYGPLVDKDGNRYEVCADIKHCIAEDAQGNCQSWGYCVREKNVWRVNGDACDAQFASCQAYKSADGKKDASFLENTLDFGSCNGDNAGCKWYARSGALAQDGVNVDWTDVTDKTKIGLNRIYLNGNALTCKAEAAGCSEFISTTGAAASVFLKKPPVWLGCDGEEGEPAVCADYARVCRSSEVGCQLYSPTNGDPKVPGMVGETDKCPAECVGYNAYKQEASNFEPVVPAVYLIPAQAQTCDITYAGCSEFTNLATEAREYFSSLRACQKPGGADDETYYTWEGAETSGYQLRSWTLKKSNQVGGIADDKIINSGSAVPPCTNINVSSDHPTCVDNATNQAVCTADDVGVNCRAFYDKDGNIFYRLYSRTVVATKDCNKYRSTGPNLVFNAALCAQYGGDWDGSTCEGFATLDEYYCATARGSWDATYKECLLAGYPAESGVCPASANTCRVFSGSAAANVKIVLGPENFENGANGWVKPPNSAATVTAESSFLGGHSLKVESGGVKYYLKELKKDASYTLTVWAKGSVSGVKLQPTLGVYESDKLVDSENFAIQVLKNDWQQVVFGPLKVNFSSVDRAPVVSFNVDGGSAYLDNILLRQVQDKLPLLKNSLQIPVSCDTSPAVMGGGYSPQAMLGCAEYKDGSNVTQYLKSFSSFCREQSAGCQDLVDTYNFSEIERREFNTENTGLCHGAPGDCKLLVNGVQTSSVCTILTGETSCAYKTDLPIDNLIVPADEQRYLVVDNKKTCQKEDRGCQALGLKDLQTDVWQTVYLRDNPDIYERSLCQYEQDGCTAWASTGGAAYFKDPGNQTCEWKTGVDIGGVKYSGWFKKSAKEPLTQAVSKAGCENLGLSWDEKKNQCLASIAPCYGKLLVTGAGNNLNLSVDLSATHLVAGAFGIWRNFNASYQGWAGECPKAQAGCKEFIDPTDKTDNNPRGQAYYYLDNDNLDKASCGGKVSRKEGCVLLNQTDITGQTWNAQMTYETSEKIRQGGLVQPQKGKCSPSDVAQGKCLCLPSDATQGKCYNNTNVILKVQRDRVCGEWLACRSWMTDPAGNSLCTYYGRCEEIGLGQEKADAPTCKAWLTENILTTDLTHQTYKMANEKNYQTERLTVENTDRWSYKELSGYTIPDARPVERLQEFVASQEKKDDTACDVLGGYCKGGLSSRPCQTNNDCQEPVRLGYFNPAGSKNLYELSSQACAGANCQCVSDGDCASKGLAGYVCEKFQSASGVTFKHCVAPKICRGYPALNAPLPKGSGLAQNNQVATCAQGNCECSYIQYQSQGVTAYYPVSQAVDRLCVQGAADKIGKMCKGDMECQTGSSAEDTKGYCMPVGSIKYYNGWRGYCLDYDKTRTVASIGGVGGDAVQACLAWAPVSLPQGEYSTFAQAPGAQYQVAKGREWYCVARTTADPNWGVVVERSLSCYPAKPYEVEVQNPAWKPGCTPIPRSGLTCVPQFIKTTKIDPAACGANSDMYEKVQYKVASVAKPTIRDMNNFFDAPQFKDGSTVNYQSLADAQDSVECKHTIGFCAVAQDAFYRINEGDGGKNLSNFLGCYHVADDDPNQSFSSNTNVLFYPYKGRYTSPVLAHQIESIWIGVNEKIDNQYADDLCQSDNVTDYNILPHSKGDGWSDDNWVKDWTAVLEGDVPSQNEMETSLQVWRWSTKKSFSGGNLAFAARFDNQGRFLGIEIEAHDFKDAGLFAITSFKMFLKPMCKEWVKVTDTGKNDRSLAYTDNLLKQTKVNNINKDEPCEPYGAVGYSAKQFNELGGYTGIISLTDEAIRKSKVCTENYAYAHNGWNSVANNLFAATYETMRLKGLTYPSMAFDDKDDDYDYGMSYSNYFKLYDPIKDPNPPDFHSQAEIKGQAPKVSDLRVNNSTEKRTFNSSVAPITLTFYGSPDKNQMPIRRLAVNWGDDTPVLVIGDSNSSFKARWPVCDNSDFAHSSEACAERPFSFSHVYFCNDPVCSFQPRVQILDNWDWCNGACTDKGCYGENICEVNSDAAKLPTAEQWTTFTNGIEIKPLP